MEDEGRTREQPGDAGALDRALRLFGGVRRGEGPTVLLMSAAHGRDGAAAAPLGG
jgi:hypothetical protein